MGSQAGVLKTAAKRIGTGFDEYMAKIDAGEKWCTFGKHWTTKAAFPPDAHRSSGNAQGCAACVEKYHRGRTEKKRARFNRSPGREKATHAVNHAVHCGMIPNPNTLDCVHCRHSGEDRRHEYHHHNGYACQHRLDVIPLCSKCHKRETRREMGLQTFVPPTEVLLAVSAN